MERTEDLTMVEQTLAVFAERCIQVCQDDGMSQHDAQALVATALRLVAEDLLLSAAKQTSMSGEAPPKPPRNASTPASRSLGPDKDRP